MRRCRLLADENAAASTEMALLVPLLIVLLFGGFEAGHFVWSQHKLTEAVRDGARFASRFPLDTFCEGAAPKTPDDAYNEAVAEIALLTRTGQVESTAARPKVPGWTDAQVLVTPQCGEFAETGIYTDWGAAGAVVTVSATDVTYPSLFHGLGIDIFGDVELSATSNAPLIGL